MRILLTGARGQVGTEFQKLDLGGAEILAPSRNELDLSNLQSIRTYVQAHRPEVIVNAGAYTAVDLAEKERDLCFAVNAAAPAALAEEAVGLGAMLIHFSTDYVFDGTKPGPYIETDPTRPLGVYGASKAEGEQAILATGARALILRTSWVYSLHGKNFLLTMLRLAHERPELRVVSDQIGAPTSARAIADAALAPDSPAIRIRCVSGRHLPHDRRRQHLVARIRRSHRAASRPRHSAHTSLPFPPINFPRRRSAPKTLSCRMRSSPPPSAFVCHPGKRN